MDLLTVNHALDSYMRILVPVSVQVALEHWHTWRVSRRLLKIYWQVRRAQPELQGAALYAQIVARRGDLGGRSPDAVVQHAMESFAAWPAERPLQFRDVVHVLAFDDYLRVHTDSRGTLSNMRKMVDRVIPETL